MDGWMDLRVGGGIEHLMVLINMITPQLILFLKIFFHCKAISRCNCLEILADSVVRCQRIQWNAKNICIQMPMIPTISN